MSPAPARPAIARKQERTWFLDRHFGVRRLIWVVPSFVKINLKEPLTGLHFWSFCGACLGFLKGYVCETSAEELLKSSRSWAACGEGVSPEPVPMLQEKSILIRLCNVHATAQLALLSSWAQWHMPVVLLLGRWSKVIFDLYSEFKQSWLYETLSQNKWKVREGEQEERKGSEGMALYVKVGRSQV